MTDTITRQQTAQANAYTRARQQAELGNAPVLVATTVNRAGVVCETFRVLSRSTEGHAYHVELWGNGRQVTTACNCEATGCCWHRASARLYHQGEIEGVNEAGYRIRLKAEPVATTTPQQCATCGLFSSTVLSSAAGRCAGCDTARRPATTITAAMLSGKV